MGFFNFFFFFLKCIIRKVTGMLYYIFVTSSQFTFYLCMIYTSVKILPEIQIAVNTAQPDGRVMWATTILKKSEIQLPFCGELERQ